MATTPWSKGQPIGEPVIPTIMNCSLPDGPQYRERQLKLFGTGLFGYVPVTEIRPNDQVFPDLGQSPLRMVVLAGQMWGARDYIIEVEHDPQVETDRDRNSTYHDPTERIFARRPDLDREGQGLRDVVLELPADMDSDGNYVMLPPPASRAARREALLRAISHATRQSAGRHARSSGVARTGFPVTLPAEEIGLGSRRGDVDWLGRVRVFSADCDMGIWEPQGLLDRRSGARA